MIEIKCPNCGIIQGWHYQYPALFWGKNIKGIVEIGGGMSCDCRKIVPLSNFQVIDDQLIRLDIGI